jgi:hypothetical protein
MFDKFAAPWERLGDLASSLTGLDQVEDDSIAGQQRKRELYESFIQSSNYLYTRLWADAWCAAFVWKKRREPHLPYPLTEEDFRKIETNPHSVPQWLKDEVRRLAEEYQFFHWHIEFPDVFWVPGPEDGRKAGNPQTGWSGGFRLRIGQSALGAREAAGKGVVRRAQP